MAGFFFGFLDQIRPKWIKLDEIGFSHQSVTIKRCHIYRKDQSENVTIKSCHIYRKDNHGFFVFDFVGSDLSKMDQT